MSTKLKLSSPTWPGFGGLEPGPLYDRIQTVPSRLNFKHLEKVALCARAQLGETTDSGLACTIDPFSFTHGFNNVVLEVLFSDGVCWIARIQHGSMDMPGALGDTRDLPSEITTMRTVRDRTSIPVPQVFAHDVSPSNEFGHPYILMERVTGRVLEGPIASQVPPEHLPKVAKQLADVLYQLHGLTFDRLGQLWSGEKGGGPVEISPFYAQRQADNRRALDGHLHDPEWTTACWVLKTAVPHIIIEDRVRGPFPLCHLDLHHGNLLFDDDYNLRGVIDWSQGQTVPVERLVVSPEFITFPAGSDEQNKNIRAFRALVHEHLQRLEGRESSADNSPAFLLSNFFGSKRADITHRCTYSFLHRALWDGRLVARLIYGDDVGWDQLLRVYGRTEVY
ncbi:kinase-like domain-containing protein [Parachaetomium inaequale]|uniref:Kinase-like domain-containing protein n=1 Tax=Parachaetomium inaequale TaxID=2588326 RepID=A0AAN6PHR6_9PEZI|nr:kinase-like domain-containing protein [Parachaetomium inaequale]